jgi:hypothetical protein
MQYYSTPQHDYQQQYPRFVCRNSSRFYEISQFKGYTCKCRNPRCSLECHQNWARKQGSIIARHLHDLPEQFTPYRGNLSLPKDASPQDHHRVRAAFLLALKRWKQRHNYIVEIHATTHVVDSNNSHYDIVAFTDAPHKPFHRAMLDLWVKAGGKPPTCVPLKEPEIDATAMYNSKAILRVSSNTDKTKKPTKLPSPNLLNSREISGLDLTWHTRKSKSSEGFWRGTKPDAIWQELCAEWFDKEATPDDIPKPYIPGNDFVQDKRRIAAKLPTDPLQAVPLWAFTRQWGLDSQPASLSEAPFYSEQWFREMPKWGDDYVLKIFKSIPNAVEDNGKWYKQVSEL